MLAALHIFIIALSNVLVQYPFRILGFHTTYGAFTYPLIFIITDLTVRLLGGETARKTVFIAMIPGLCVSYVLANYFSSNAAGLLAWNSVVFRVAVASFSAYVIGQLLDIHIFQRLRQKQQSWWLAPSVSTFFGNLIDTYVFFFLAFFHSKNAFLAQHWLEIAHVDVCFKWLISFGALVPVYGLVLKWCLQRSRDMVASLAN